MTERLWVFGYGSLIWSPCFPAERSLIARLDGWHRSFCMDSIHYRGTPEMPGLVLALDRAEAASCTGVAFLVEDGAEDQAMAELRERELVSSAYLEKRLAVHMADTSVEAVTYVIDPAHAQYRGGLPLDDQARIIAGATGQMGPNPDYLFNTVAHLDKLGIPDPDLHQLAAKVRRLTS